MRSDAGPILPRALLAASLLILVAGCAVPRSQRGFRAGAELMQVDARGSWIDLVIDEGLDDRDRRRLRSSFGGELLAVDGDSVHVLTMEGRLESVSWSRVRKGRLEAWSSDVYGVMGLGAGLSLLAIGHGVFGIFTLPLAIMTTAAMTSELSWRPMHNASAEDAVNLRPFARFPAGLPKGLDRAAFTPLPLPTSWSGDIAVQSMSSQPFTSREGLQPGTAPGSLPGAWVKGSLRAGQPPEAGIDSYPWTRRFTGLLLALDADTLFLYSGAVRALPRSSLHKAMLFAGGAGNVARHRLGGIWNDRDVTMARVACFPGGLTPRHRAARVDSLLTDIRSNRKGAAALDNLSRWPMK